MSTEPARTFHLTRLIEATPAAVWQAWTEPARMAQWWGPHGFTAEVSEMEVRRGGAYRITMCGEDGGRYPLRGEYREVAAPARLVMTVDCSEHPPEWHQLLRENGSGEIGEIVQTVTLAPAEGGTRLEVVMEFAAAQTRDAFVKVGMEGGWMQSLEKLEDLLAGDRQVVTRREFDETAEAIFECYQEPERLARWWGPKGFRSTFEEFDFRPGGAWRMVMHGPDGTDYPNHSVFEVVEPARRIVFRHLDPVHDFRMFITLSTDDEKTEMVWRMRFPTPEHCARVKALVTGANEENFDRLAAELARVP